MHCPIHTRRELSCSACEGAKGGRSKSAQKIKAARKNGARNKPKSVQAAADEVMRVTSRIQFTKTQDYASGRNNAIRKGTMSAFGTLQAPATSNPTESQGLPDFRGALFLSI